jgi:hypothetical protein
MFVFFCIISAGNCCILLAIFVIVSYFKPIREESLNSQWNLHCISFFALYFIFCTVFLFLHCISFFALYFFFCTVFHFLHCISFFALYFIFCTLFHFLHCISFFALYFIFCTVFHFLHCISFFVLYFIFLHSSQYFEKNALLLANQNWGIFSGILLVYKFGNVSSEILAGSIGVYFPEVLQ